MIRAGAERPDRPPGTLAGFWRPADTRRQQRQSPEGRTGCL